MAQCSECNANVDTYPDGKVCRHGGVQGGECLGSGRYPASPTFTFAIKLPIAADELGRWLEAHGADISIQCMLGTYHVHVGQKKLLSYSDKAGEHYEAWEISRYDRDLMVALEAALRAAGALT